MRQAACKLADTFFKGSLNDGISSDLFLQQNYHVSQENMFTKKIVIKTDEERYFEDSGREEGCDNFDGPELVAYQQAGIDAE